MSLFEAVEWLEDLLADGFLDEDTAEAVTTVLDYIEELESM